MSMHSLRPDGNHLGSNPWNHRIDVSTAISTSRAQHVGCMSIEKYTLAAPIAELPHARGKWGTPNTKGFN